MTRLRVLQQAKLSETAAAVSAEYEMIDKRAAERFGGAGEAAGCATVAVAGRRIPARVIVREEDCGAAMQRCVGNDRAKREVGPALVALVPRQMKTARLIVEVGDPQGFERRIALGETAGEESARGGEAIQL